MARPSVSSFLRYRRIVNLTLADQAVNLAQATALGHRLAVEVDAAMMNKWFLWARDASSVSPIGGFLNQPADASGFDVYMTEKLNGQYTDQDADSKGLSYSSSDLTGGKDDRARATGTGAAPGYSVNDWVVAYILFRVFGSSSTDTTEDTGVAIYNMEDMYSLLESQVVAEAIRDSLLMETTTGTSNQAIFDPSGSAVDASGNLTSGDASSSSLPAAINQMFRAHLAANPFRFFDASGKQQPGLFEVSADVDASGNWELAAGDVIEIPLKISFANVVTSTSTVNDPLSNPTNYKDPSGLPVVINSGESINIRLQLKCA